MTILFPRYPFLNEEETKIASGFDLAAFEMQTKKILYLREIARKKGITAEKIEDLKSESGKPFVEEKPKGYWGHEYRRAVIAEEKTFGPHVETAYLCQGIYVKDDPDSCGWVIGSPIEKKYDEIQVLSGSRGTRYYCRICGKQIGEHKTAFSLH